ncbi:hypothetical protein [Aestuariibaculum sediminum]|uniref:Uncharacterized protein n=1 Tax=Aestuariibaculum sediminum TaxID=2770637 RepID=A0A8J6Q2Z4_9FLAO|nr:hypothetical protein [Aestuariibaculum sediminum]MBD0832826.1 hypothetical protein [Aestuariibaculum sediminum]
MSKKYPIKNSDPSVNLRLSKELKETIQAEAAKRNVTVSKYLRELLELIYSGDYCRYEVLNDKVENFLFSKDFIQLVVWIYSKRYKREKTESSEELDRYIATLKKVHFHVPDHLAREFDKVLQDVMKVRYDESKYTTSFFWFLESGLEKEKFNLKLLEQFLLDNRALKEYVLEEINDLS